LTELQGGQIGVSSTAGVGSNFAFYVKAMQVSPISRRSSDISTNGITQSTEDKSTHRAGTLKTTTTVATPIRNDIAAQQPEKLNLKRKLNILLTEDNIINQRVIAAQLRRLGNTVHVANHGLEALHFLQKTTFASGCTRSASLPSSPVQENGHAEVDTPLIPLDIMLLDQGKPITLPL